MGALIIQEQKKNCYFLQKAIIHLMQVGWLE